MMFFLNHSLRKSYHEQLRNNLYDQSILIRNQIINDIKSNSPGIIDKWAKNMGQKIDKRITIINKHGFVLGDSDYNPQDMDNHINRPEVQTILNGNLQGVSIRRSDTLKMDMFYLAIPISIKEDIIGFIRLSKSLQDINRTIQNNIKNNLLFFILMLIITLVLVWRFSQDIINPLSQITRLAGKLAKGDFTEKINIKSYDNEIGTLARVFNHMAFQLESKISQLSEEKNRAEAILSSMVDGLVAVDKEFKIRIINPAAQKIFKITDNNITGKEIIEVFRYHEIDRGLEEALTENKIFTREIVIQIEEKRILRCNFAPINNDSGYVIGGIVVFSDITELRKLEQLRKDFVGNVSHELRTPLTSIIGYLDTILDNEINDSKTIRKFLNVIKTEADRLALLIKDLLDLSKLENKNKYILRPGFLNKIIKKTILMLKDKAEEKDINIIDDIENNYMVYMIPEQIEQVCTNLIDNAIKYTPAGGEIKVRVYEEDNKRNGNKNDDTSKIVIEIEDNGIGIPEKEQDRIFERFYRVDKARSRSLGGTGIGLSIVKHILQNHKNTIEVESKVGKGSIFRFYLNKVK